MFKKFKTASVTTRFNNHRYWQCSGCGRRSILLINSKCPSCNKPRSTMDATHD